MYEKIELEKSVATLKVARGLRNMLKVHAAQRGVSMRSVVDEVIYEYLDRIGDIDSSYSLEERGQDDKARLN